VVEEIYEEANDYGGGAAAADRPVDRTERRFRKTLRQLFRKGKPLASNEQPPADSLIKAICGVVRQGNYPEVACRAFGVRSGLFKEWVRRGFEDVQNGEATQYALFVTAVDAADAQAEVQDVNMIRAGIEDWQALAWLRERKSFQRWGIKSLQLQGDMAEQLTDKVIKAQELSPEETGEVLAALEAAGVVLVPGQEEFSGEPDVIEVAAKGADTVEAAPGEESVELD
jgi:hypothetical protein